MTTGPDRIADYWDDAWAEWRLPSYIWLEHVRRAWLEAAEREWNKVYEERRAQTNVLRLLQWRGIDVPPVVRCMIRLTTDPDELRAMSDRAYEVTDPHGVFGVKPSARPE